MRHNINTNRIMINPHFSPVKYLTIKTASISFKESFITNLGDLVLSLALFSQDDK